MVALRTKPSLRIHGSSQDAVRYVEMAGRAGGSQDGNIDDDYVETDGKVVAVRVKFGSFCLLFTQKQWV